MQPVFWGKVMKVCNQSQIQAIDKRSIEEFGIPSLILMENAGTMSALKLIELFPQIKDLIVAIFVGKGNNGGDGLVIARHLSNQGIDVRVYLIGEKPAKGDALINLEIIQRLGLKIIHIDYSLTLQKELSSILEADILIDALLGTGASGEIKGIISEIIELLNSTDQPVISIDIPSGLDCDTGRPLGVCVQADYTFTLGLPKIGLLIYPGVEFVGQIILLDIGIPVQLLIDENIKVNLLQAKGIQSLLPVHPPFAHKGQCGRVVVLAGSIGMTGAATLCSQSVLSIGAGLVMLGIPESLNDIVETKLTEVITVPLPETESRTLSIRAYEKIMPLLSNASAVVIGPGLGRNDETCVLVRTIVSQLTASISVPILIDADGIFALSQDKTIFNNIKSPVVITPHPGEMANFLEIDIKDVQADRLAIAQKTAQSYGITVVLKGARTVIADKNGNCYINPTGNVGLATAGTGDVLAGFITGLIAQGLSSESACCLGVFLHGLCGDLVTKEKGTLSLVASDLINKLPEAIKIVKSE